MAPLRQVNGEATSSSRRNNKRKKLKLGKDSGQTDAERRMLRSQLRKLQQTIRDNNGNDKDAADADELREQSNHLFESVHYTREAVLDGDNIHLLSNMAAKEAKALVHIPRYDAARFSTKILQKCGAGGSLDWNLLGTEAGACFNAVPSNVVFLGGPLHADYTPKPRKVRAPKTQEEEEEEEEQDEEEEHEESQQEKKNHLSQVERHITKLSKSLRQKCKESHALKLQHVEDTITDPDEKSQAIRMLRKKGYDVDAMELLLDPNSFTKTVENFFHFSFLIKKGSARWNLTSMGLAARAVSRDVQDGGGAPDRQAVLALTMHDWRELCKAYGMH